MRPHHILTFSFAITAATILPAQSKVLDVRLGATSAYLHAPNGSRTVQGATTGVSFSLSVARWLAFESGLAYTEKGGFTQSDPQSPFIHLSYLEAPLLIRISDPELARFRPFVFLGIVPAAQLRCSAAVTQNPQQFLPELSVKVVHPASQSLGCGNYLDSRIKDIGTALGGGLALNLSRRTYAIEVRRVRGWRDVGFSQAPLRNDYVAVALSASLWRHQMPHR